MPTCFTCKINYEYGVICSTYKFCSIECMNNTLKLNDLINLFSNISTPKEPLTQSPEVSLSQAVQGL